MKSTTQLRTVGIGYTLASGRLFCNMAEFQQYAEDLLGRPVLTHELADRATWDELRQAFETSALNELGEKGGQS